MPTPCPCQPAAAAAAGVQLITPLWQLQRGRLLRALLDLGLSLGRAPLHALAVGFFGTVLVAMATRVTAGHSGRPLVLGRVAAFAFVGMQLVALSRVIAEWMPDPGLWWRGTALAWVLVFLPWVLRSAWIYATPRLDGKPG